MLEDRQDSGWNVEFYGAGIDAYNDAKKLGFTQKNSICFESTSKDSHVVACMAKMACAKSMECRRRISEFDDIKTEDKNPNKIEIKSNSKNTFLKSLKLKLKRFKRQILKLFKKTQKAEKQ